MKTCLLLGTVKFGRRILIGSAFVIALTWLSSARVLAQPAGQTVTIDAATLQQLLQRVDALEREVKDLRATRTPSGASAPAVAAPASPVPVAVTAAPVDTREHYPQLEFHLLGDITLATSTEHGSKSTFALGDLDPVVTAKLSPNANVLGDFVIASDQQGFQFEVERLLAQYKVNDSLAFEVGRYHTMIGYYNNTYHNGTYFQTTVDRPAIYDFEDGGGILPVHSNGVSINGEIPSGSLGLHYVAEVANGRDYDPEHAVFEVTDTNEHKAVNFALFARPEALPGTQFGASAYRDRLTLGELAVDQQIYSAYAVYKRGAIEWLNEGLLMRNTPVGDHAYSTTNFYTQFSRKFGKLRPYVRLEWRHTAEGDPVLSPLEQNESFRTQTIGLRYDFTPMMALKAELERNLLPDESTTQATAQFTFRY